MKDKETIRNIVWEKLQKEGISHSPYGRIPPFKGQEEAAELLRKLKIYKNAKKIFVPPDQAQYPVRFNCIEDGKILIMATPGLKDGFYEITKNNPNWKKAIHSHQVKYYGKKLKTNFEEIGKIDLMVTGAVAVSKKGQRIGKGSGFFDWEYKILREIGSVDEDTPIVAVVHFLQIFEELPFSFYDVSINYIVTPKEIIKIENPASRPSGIDWEYIKNKNKNLIKKMRPLKEIWITLCSK